MGYGWRTRRPGTLYGESTDAPLCDSTRNPWTLTPSRTYDSNSSRRWWPRRPTSSQIVVCFRSKPGTNRLPFSPESHIGARHGIRRNGPRMGSRHTSSHVGHSPGPAGRPPERTHCTHSCSVMLSDGVAGSMDCTRAWRWSSRRNHWLESTYRARMNAKRLIPVLLYPRCASGLPSL